MSFITHLECSVCAHIHPAGKLINLCHCGGPLLVRYDLDRVRSSWDKDALVKAAKTMWRYAPLLPADPQDVVSLGEGMTPLLPAPKLAARLGVQKLYVKDESLNPTASFKARGMAAAVSMAASMGARKLAVPTAGNAGSALAAYAAAAGCEAFIFMPRDTPQANFLECQAMGAHVTLVDGLINDCGRIVAERKQAEGWFEVSTLKEPYRIEGKKTMGFEIAEQLGWRLPDAIFYPCGGGVGLIGMWKAFAELEAIGWIGSERPKMIAVQSEGCQPIVRAFEHGAETAELWQNAHTVATGLRVPKPLGDRLSLRALRESHGTAIAVSDAEMMNASRELGAVEGIFCAPEGGACVAAYRKLLSSGFLHADAEVVLFNTGSGLKYLEAYAGSLPTPDNSPTGSA